MGILPISPKGQLRAPQLETHNWKRTPRLQVPVQAGNGSQPPGQRQGGGRAESPQAGQVSVGDQAGTELLPVR